MEVGGHPQTLGKGASPLCTLQGDSQGSHTAVPVHPPGEGGVSPPSMGENTGEGDRRSSARRQETILDLFPDEHSQPLAGANSGTLGDAG